MARSTRNNITVLVCYWIIWYPISLMSLTGRRTSETKTDAFSTGNVIRGNDGRDDSGSCSRSLDSEFEITSAINRDRLPAECSVSRLKKIAAVVSGVRLFKLLYVKREVIFSDSFIWRSTGPVCVICYFFFRNASVRCADEPSKWEKRENLTINPNKKKRKKSRRMPNTRYRREINKRIHVFVCSDLKIK